ncbi:hypothetical protein DJ529_00155 [Sulfolobus sp. C3]|nr:hypothetical protein DJ529_00155 [Sulfolobus sp. C3]
MRFEVAIDSVRGIGKRYLSNEGHIVEIDSSLEAELNSIRISAKLFIEGILEFISEKSSTYSFFIPSKALSGECSNVLDIFELWVTFPNESYQKFLVVIINIEGNAQIFLLKPELYKDLSEDILSNLANKYKCLDIIMPFIYRFVVFDTFNAFKRVFDTTFEGVIDIHGEKYLTTISNSKKALMWKIDSTNVRYVSNNLIPIELLRLLG